ncbi:hypothetical protein BO71DRAFT_405699 [Aspergillus ellipticus CBS 707.79]|uniref:Uncharacterized protein n=1 Tax=Aspergillus ellipticus CBS 707.79 TaxID=1448320 RepID=A0A319DNK0_9EURO|nr:hypothetical protein BO71DRAFT_405699 [Aspergillus ellipticus CBS 707.79]
MRPDGDPEITLNSYEPWMRDHGYGNTLCDRYWLIHWSGSSQSGSLACGTGIVPVRSPMIVLPPGTATSIEWSGVRSPSYATKSVFRPEWWVWTYVLSTGATRGGTLGNYLARPGHIAGLHSWLIQHPHRIFALPIDPPPLLIYVELVLPDTENQTSG